jgi:tetratricopeptide (TPR) repeat protein
MELGRVVAVVAVLSGGREQVGSGYVVAERLVLTAAHCTQDRLSGASAESIHVQRADDGAQVAVDPARLTIAKDADMAIIHLEEAGFTAGMPMVCFARVRREPGVLSDCTAIGYPLFQFDHKEQRFFTAELHGEIHQTDGHELGRLLMRDPTTVPGGPASAQGLTLVAESRDASGSIWGGLSGAVVFHNGCAVGMVVQHHPTQGATAVQLATFDQLLNGRQPDAKAVAAALGIERLDQLAYATTDSTPDGRLAASSRDSQADAGGQLQPRYRLDYLSVQNEPVDIAWLREQPSRMLDARSQVVEFQGRRDELESLSRWRDDDGQRGLSVRLLHGPGGQGKSRLANKFGEVSVEEGWTVVTARQTPGPTSRSDEAPKLRATPVRVLLIVDYADRWSHTELLSLFEDPLVAVTSARVLLIGRSVQWWPAVRGELAESYASTDDQRLGPLAQLAHDRQTVFLAARDRFADLLGLPKPHNVGPPGSLAAPTYGLVLALHMAALVAVDASIRGQRPPPDPEDLAAYLLDREYTNWRRLYGSRTQGEEFETPPSVMARTVFVAALTGAVDYDTGSTAIERVGLNPSQRILTDHRVCYPPADRRMVLEALLPDRLAEDFLALLTPGHDVTGYEPDPWTTSAATTMLMRGDNGCLPEYAPRAITFLSAAAARWPHLRKTLGDLVSSDPRVVIDAGNAALAAFAEIPDMEATALESVRSTLPGDRHVDLDPGIASFMRRFVEHRLMQGADQKTRVDLWLQLALRYYQAGLYDEAIAELGRARDVVNQLMETDANKHEPTMAWILDSLSVYLTHLGRDDDALEVSRQALDIYRRLANREPEEYRSDLARALNNYSADLGVAGHLREGLEGNEEALTIFDALAAKNPQEYEPDVAWTLLTSSIKLSKLGDHRAALALTKQSRDIYQRLYDSRPDVYAPDLARTLMDESSCAAEVDRRLDAISPAKAAVTLYRKLASSNPEGFELELANSLDVLGNRLSNVGLFDEALRATREGYDICQRLSLERRAGTLVHDLAYSAVNMGCRLIDCGRLIEAVTFTREGRATFERLAHSDVAKFQPDVGWSSVILGEALCKLGLFGEGIRMLEDSTHIYRGYAETNSNVYQPKLADALCELGNALLLAGRNRDATSANNEAVEIYRALVRLHPEMHEADLANGLLGYAEIRLETAFEMADARSAAQEAVAVYRRLATEFPPKFLDKRNSAQKILAAIDRMGC